MAKKLTLAILLITFVMGVIGSWFKAFDMEDYTLFLKAFGVLYIPLIASIGGNSAMEKWTNSKEQKSG